MRTICCLAVSCVALLSLGAASLITEDEALVSGVLTELKFEPVPSAQKIVGAKPRFKVSKKSLDFLASVMKDGKTIEVQPNGTIKIVK